ncbi:MAG: ABC transporter permease [Acidobacteriota bacterium]
MVWNAFGIALREIRRNLVRAALTVLGVVIGVAAVVVMVTLGDGATASVTDQVKSLGSNLIVARPGRGLGPGSTSSAPGFEAADAAAIVDAVPEASAAVPVRNLSVTAVYLQENWSTQAVGSTVDYFEVAGWSLASGRFFTEAEARAARPVCVLGSSLAATLFGQLEPLGAEVRLKTLSCRVVGVLETKGQGAMGNDQDDVVVLPLTTLERRLAGRVGRRDISTLMISARDGVSTDRVVQSVAVVLRERRGIAANEDDDFSVIDTEQIAATLGATTRILTMLLGAVAAVSLLVGGIGIMNIMLVSVTERTREIGIRMAIGALPREVRWQFMVESVVLSVVGGLVGIALALVGSIALADLMGIPFRFGTRINLIAFAFSAAVGVLFGFMPARRAARLDPIEALRHE